MSKKNRGGVHDDPRSNGRIMTVPGNGIPASRRDWLEGEEARLRGELDGVVRERLELEQAEARALQAAAEEAERLARYWPAGKPMPEVIRLKRGERRRELVPCPACRRLRLDTGSQAVASAGTPGDVMWFRCRAAGCEHTFKLGVEWEE